MNKKITPKSKQVLTFSDLGLSREILKAVEKKGKSKRRKFSKRNEKKKNHYWFFFFVYEKQ